MDAEARITALAALAADWQDPDVEPRAEAVRATLEASGRYTEEGLAFALNHRMHQLTESALREWAGDVMEPPEALRVAVSAYGGAPLGGLEEALAAWLLGHRVVLDETIARVVGVFLAELDPLLQNKPLAGADVWLAEVPRDEAEARRTEAAEAGIPEERCLFRTLGSAVAVLDGREDAAAWSGLAEDLLLHDGQSAAAPRIVWVPAGTSPDALLNAMAGFRELFPAHPDTDGTLSLPAAFLAAADRPRASGPGFLVSLGEPEPQAPAHVRWTEYEDLDAVRQWLNEQGEAVHLVVATSGVADRLGLSRPTVPPGDAHRPALDPHVPAFLRRL